MDDENNLSFRLKSVNNQYEINLNFLNNLQPQILEITLIHKINENDKIFFLQRNREQLISENQNLSEFNTIQEIFKYIITLIKNHHIKIIRPNSSYYYIKLNDPQKNIEFLILIPRKEENYSKKEKKEEIESLKKELIHCQKQIDILTEKISKIDAPKEDDNNNNNSSFNSGNNFENDRNPSSNYTSNSEPIDEDWRTIYKENNNNISFFNSPNKINKESIISDKEDQCENFTAFKNMNEDNIIVWTLRGKGEIKLYSFKERTNLRLENAHSKNINCIQYFHCHLEFKDYIISLSQSDENIMKIWLLDIDNNNITLEKEFKKSEFNMNIEIFCTFNWKKDKNSFLFVYGDHIDNRKINGFVYNSVKSKEILCYKLDEYLNIINWDDNEEINYKKINNFYTVNNLDTYYDYDTDELYLINSNTNDVEIINDLFKINRGKIFQYENWNTHLSSFIKKIDNSLKLFDICLNGLIIWNLKNNEQPEYKCNIDDFCPFDLISWNKDYLFISGNDRILIFNVSEKKIVKTIPKDKKGFSKIRKINTPESSELIVTIDNYQVKCLYFDK